MADNSEIDERIDLEDDSYIDESDEEVADEGDDGTGDDEPDEETGDDKADDGTGDDKADDGTGDDKAEEQAEKFISDGGRRERLLKDEENYTDGLSKEEKQKRAELLTRPPFGSEVFIGGLPKDVTEDDLTDLCEPIGDTYEVRLMKNKDTGELKGYAFVSFKTKEDGQKAIEELTNKRFKGKTLRCSLSDANHRLFMGNIPKSWSQEQFEKTIREVGPGAELIDLKQDTLNPGRNRGFAFIEYYNNACADYSRQKMSNGSFELEGKIPTVTWADPKSAPDSTATSQVKALYVKNIPEGATPVQLKELFQRHGEVTKVVLPPGKGGTKGNFGFVYFSERSCALKAVKESEIYEINGQLLEVTMARPQTDKKTVAAAPPFNAVAAAAAASYLTQPAYSFAGNPYGSFGAGLGIAGGFQQPMIAQPPSNMQMVPMILPDGRVGYVMQQPGMQQPGMQMSPPILPQRNDRPSGGRGRGRGRSSDSGDGGYSNRRYRPY